MAPPIVGTTANRKTGATVLSVREVRAAEQVLFDAGTDPFALMVRAGEAAARAIMAFTGPCEALVLCGPGNNGGDGYVVAAALARANWPVRVAALAEPGTASARSARARWVGPVEALAAASAAPAPAPLVVDALFGIGLARALDPGLASDLAGLLKAARVRVALDLPSAVAADSGALLGAATAFDLTVALGALKPAHLLHPAAALMGRVVVVDLGHDTASQLHANVAPAPPRFGPVGYKQERGHVLVLGGGPARGGAARLSARAALRGGAGLVTLAVPSVAVAENAARLDAIMLRPLDCAADLAALVAERRASVVALGPGLGTDDSARALVEAALALDLPLALDADVFTLFAGDPDAIHRVAPTVLTPHEGECTRMFGALSGSKVDRARAAARHSQAVVLLKGPDTVITHPDGRAAIENARAPWLATAGSGDVLTGAIAARLAGGEDAFAAACAGAWLHARAGEAGAPGMTADDLPELLANALVRLAL